MRKALALTALTLLVAASLVGAAPVASGANITQFIREINATWGTPSTPTGASPGDSNVPLTMTFQYTYPLGASSVQGLLTLPAGFTLFDGTNETYASTSGAVPSDSIFQLTYDGIFLSPTLATGLYNFSLGLWAYSGASIVLQQNSTIGVFVLGNAQLQFGTPSPSISAGQVSQVPLTISNTGSGNATQVSLTVSASGVSILTPSLELPSLAAGQSKSLEVEVYVPSSASGTTVTLLVAATFSDPYGVQQSVTQGVGFYVTAPSTYPLDFQSADTSLVPGGINSIPITITNEEPGSAYQIHTLVSSSSQVSILTQFPVISELAANASVTEPLEAFVSASLADAPLSLTFSYSFTDAQGFTSSYTQSVGLFTIGSNSTLSSLVVSVSPVQSLVRVGAESKVVFDVKDVGSTSLESPVLSLSVSSPLIVLRNSSYALAGAIDSGSTVSYDAVVSSSTSATPGYYSASITVTYADQSGSVETATVPTALTLGGTIDLILQSPEVTQGNTTLSVSGEILNEGFSSAYYASVTGSLAGSRGTSVADYVGEIDPNTPVPFSITINYTPQSTSRSANISIGVTFMDSLGLQGEARSYVQTIITPASLTGSGSSSSATSGVDLFTYLEVGVIVVLVVVAVVGFVYIRRSRASGGPTEPQEKEDKGVI